MKASSKRVVREAIRVIGRSAATGELFTAAAHAIGIPPFRAAVRLAANARAEVVLAGEIDWLSSSADLNGALCSLAEQWLLEGWMP